MITIHYSTKPFDSLSAETIKTLSSLSFRNGYGITADIALYNEYKRKNFKEKTKTWSAIMAKHNGQIVAWAMVRNMKKSSYMMFYVKPSYRRLGIGKKLFDLSKAYLIRKGRDTSIVFPHDRVSSGFFNDATSTLKAQKFANVKCKVFLKGKKDNVNNSIAA